MKNRSYYTLIAIFTASLFMLSCKKDKEEVVVVPDSPKPTADFTYTLVDENDPFTFKFENLSTNFKEIRWEFGDDTTTTDKSPVHTFINTGEYRVRMIAQNDQGYWAQKETKIILTDDNVFSVTSTPGANGAVIVTLGSTIATSTINWYKGTGTTATLVESGPSATITVPAGTYENYSVRITTPKGSKAELIRMVGAGGVFKDVTNSGLLEVSRDNDSGKDAKEGSLKLIDKDLKSKFVQFNYNGTFWTQLDFKEEPIVVGAYSITSGDDAPERDPKDFKLEASNDLTTWVTVDAHIAELFATRGLTKTYLVENTEAYRYYRLNIPKINGAGLIQIAEWRLLVIQ